MSLNVTRSSLPPFEEYCEEIRDLWDSRWLTNMGAKHEALAARLRETLGVPNVTLYTTGHLALENALAAFRFPAGSEVITTPFTFASTTHAIARCGLTPVFCDVKADDFTMDSAKIEALITEKTVAILPVHVYGLLCDTDAIAEIAARHGLRVIYDAAHAFGVRKNGVSSACFGDVAMFSFHATKVFNTIEGGALCYADDALRPVLDCAKNFGLSGEDCEVPGGNAKMNEFQAAMGLCNLRHLDGEIAKRRRAAETYRRLLSGVPGIRLAPEQPGVEQNYAYFPVVFDGFRADRDQIFEELRANDVIARKYFYPVTDEFSCYRELPTASATPVASYLAKRVLCLPLFADLAEEDAARIARIILGE